MKKLFIIFALILFSTTWSNAAKVLYVDGNLHNDCVNGNYSLDSRNCDGNDGDAYDDFEQGVNILSAGDTLYVRAGTYYPDAGGVDQSVNGTPDNRITISGYKSEKAIIDGRGAHPIYDWDDLVHTEGAYVTIENITVRNSLWRGLTMRGDYSEAINVTAHGNLENGIWMRSDYGLVDSCIAYDNNRSNADCAFSRQTWGVGISCSSWQEIPTGCTIRNSISYENWGEGISTYESTNVLLEDNISYDNFSVQLYISDATNVVVQRNLVYATGFIDCTIDGHTRHDDGISLSSEGQSPDISNVTVINNYVIGTRRGFSFFGTEDLDPLINTTIANNSFLNATGGVVNFHIVERSNHRNVVIKNNIIRQDDSAMIAYATSLGDLQFSYNSWSKPKKDVDIDAQGPGDIYASGNCEVEEKQFPPDNLRLKINEKE